MKSLPNLISLSRIVLILPLLVALFIGSYAWAFGIFLVAAVSDGLDGAIARLSHATTRLGSLLDPIADKLLVITTMLMLYVSHKFPLWLLVAILIRTITVVICGSIYQRTVKQYEFTPNILSKVNVFLEFVLIAVILYFEAWAGFDYAYVQLLQFLVYATTVTSLLHYACSWIQGVKRSRT